MKEREGFVSNSSSTSFTFCFKGKKLKDLTDLLLTKYRDKFRRSFEEWHCNALDVVNAMEKCMEQSDCYSKIEIVSINKLILEEKAFIKRQKEDLKEYRKKGDKWLIEIVLRNIGVGKNKLQKLNNIKKREFNSVLVMGFGDNHGHVSGGNLGYAMDYDGREININSSDLVVFTEQNR